MQEKIANLEIKIFYDSAITKKKKGRELAKPWGEQGPGTLQMAPRSQGSDNRESGQVGAPHPRSPRRAGGSRASRQLELSERVT